MIFLSCQPHDMYFAWQLEVMITNFRKHGISDKIHAVIWYPDIRTQKAKKQPQEPFNEQIWRRMEKKYPEVKFFYYRDSVLDIGLYIPVLRPRTLAKHFDKYPELSLTPVFYHDSDIIFNKLPDFDSLCNNPISWESDTSGYLDYNYLRRKEIEGNIPEEEAISTLCKIGGISVETLKSYAGKTGGAQYLLKGVDGDFWRNVERQSMEIRKAFFYNFPNSINRKYFPSEAAGFQSWCADMWAVNMALWARNKETDVTPQLDFSWATDDQETFLRKNIFHNAGVSSNNQQLFYKGAWINKSPIGKQHIIKENSAQQAYIDIINNL